jgi:hypothetical protein
MVEHVQQFSKPAFVKRLNHVIDRAQKSLYFNAVQLPRLPFTCAKEIPHDHSAIGTAFIFIHSPGWHIKMILRNTMYMLGPNWRLAIAYPTYMDEYVRILMDNTLGLHLGQTKLLPLDIQVSNTDAYRYCYAPPISGPALAPPVLLRHLTTITSTTSSSSSPSFSSSSNSSNSSSTTTTTQPPAHVQELLG